MEASTRQFEAVVSSIGNVPNPLAILSEEAGRVGVEVAQYSKDSLSVMLQRVYDLGVGNLDLRDMGVRPSLNAAVTAAIALSRLWGFDKDDSGQDRKPRPVLFVVPSKEKAEELNNGCPVVPV